MFIFDLKRPLPARLIFQRCVQDLQLEMEDTFELRGDDGHVKISVGQVYGFPESTSYFGGYDTQSEIEIKCQSYSVKGILWTTTGELFDFYKRLEDCQKQLKGTCEFKTYEGHLQLKIEYNNVGQTRITGQYRERPDLLTQLTFEINGDQTYLQHSVSELRSIADKYGDNYGVRK